jgi:hypothetical protein
MTTVSVAPSTEVEAYIEKVWSLLTRPDGFDLWSEAVLVAAEPEGRAHPGQILHLVTRALGWASAITIEVLEVDAERHRLHVLIRLPFGLVNDEVIAMTEAGEDRTLVRFRCDYTLPPGWWGRVLGVLLRRDIRRGPVTALRRLKRAAEALVQPGGRGG